MTTTITTKRGRGRPAHGRTIYVAELPRVLLTKIQRLAADKGMSVGQVWSQVVRAGANSVGA